MNKLYSTIFNLVALSVVIYIGVDMFYNVLSSQLDLIETREVVARKSPPVQIYGRPPLRDFGIVIERNIFGASKKPPKTTKAVELEEKEIDALNPTTLKVSLLGTVSGNQENSYAVIEETRKKKQGLYKRGDTIQNASIKKILRGKVILRVGDRDEILTMEEAASQKAKKGRGSRPGIRKGSTITLARSDIEKSFKNLGQLLTQVRIRPHIKNGKSDGLEIARIKRGSVFSKLGLRNGDIVQRINGNEIKSPDDAFSLYQSLKSGSQISLDIIRKGEPQQIDYNFR
jgi:general secretion pathway protein C